jgi:uncharacterized membrane protein YcaP (DUF421 family)
MNPVLKALAIYFFVLLIFRFMGKKNLAETTTFDLVLLLIISETTSNALTGNDYSLITSFLLISTMCGADYLLGKLKITNKKIDHVIDGAPLVLVNEGEPLKVRMHKAKVDIDDILEAARMTQGLERLEQIRYAVLEKDGSISIIPERRKDGG